jgi:CRISPR-associated protein Cst2
MNLFATALTYAAPSANYRGESEENRAVIQKITRGRFEYPIISPEAIRNALREILNKYGLPCNRQRLDNEEQLAVKFNDYPWPEKFADDFLFGYMVADRGQVPAKVAKERNLKFKRDSVLRMNMALGLEPYRHDAVFTQSPLTVKNPSAPWQNATTSALLHRETSVTAFQYPFALNLSDFEFDGNESETRKLWLSSLLKAVSELNEVAGNHARSYFEMAPASIVIRLTPALVAGYETYGFRPDGSFPEVVEGILAEDYPAGEFYIGGVLVRDILPEENKVYIFIAWLLAPCMQSVGKRVGLASCKKLRRNRNDSIASEGTVRSVPIFHCW